MIHYDQREIELELIRFLIGEELSHYHAQAVRDEETRRVMDEANAMQADYIRKGVCDRCGARSAAEAEKVCQPTRDITDEWTCPGELLWKETEEGRR